MTRFSDKGFPSRVPVGLPCKAWEIEATDSFSGEFLGLRGVPDDTPGNAGLVGQSSCVGGLQCP